MQEVFEKIKVMLAEQYRKNRYESHNDEWNVGIDQSEQIVNEVAAEYNNGWLLCSERLPNYEESKNLMFTCGCDCEIGSYRWMASDDSAWYSRNSSCYVDRKVVIAWQPLPQPYELKEGEA